MRSIDLARAATPLSAFVQPARSRFWAIVLVCLTAIGASGLLAGQVAAQPAGGASDSPRSATSSWSAALPSVSQIEAKLGEVEGSAALDEEAKAKLLEQYRRALSHLESTRTFDAKTAELAQVLTEAPGEIDAIEARLTRVEGADTMATIPEDIPSDALAQRLSQTQADAAVEETRVKELDKVIDSEAERPKLARNRLAEIQSALDEVETELSQLATEDPASGLAQARRWALETRRESLWAEARMLEQELRSQSVRGALLRARREQAARNLERIRAEQRRLEEIHNRRLQAEAEAAEREFERATADAADKPKPVREAIEENARISTETGDLARRLDRHAEKTSAVKAEQARVEQDFKDARQRIEAAGLSRALGQLLLERREELPDRRRLRRAIDEREEAIADATLKQIRYREEARHLRDRDRYLDELVAEDPAAQTAELRASLAEALEQRRRLIGQALEIYDDYVRQLSELNYATEQLLEATERYEEFLDERLLWVRSSQALDLEALNGIPVAISWLLDPKHWQEVLHVFAHESRHSPAFWAGWLILALYFWKLSSLRRAICSTAEPLRRIRTDRLGYTFKAIGLTLLGALPVPLLLWLLGRQLGVSEEASGFTRSLGSALMGVAFGLYCLRAFRLLCMRDGVADRHFRWSAGVLRRLRQELRWFTLYIVPVAVLTLLLLTDTDPAVRGSLGRLALIAIMLGLSIFYARLLDPKKGVLSEALAERPDGLLNRSRHIWYTLIAGSPLALAVLALLGYGYTAGVLFRSLVQQTWLAFLLITVHQVIVRWLMVTRRRLALQAALERQAARRAQSEAPGKPAGVAGDALPQVEEPEPDLAALDEQTRRLINASIIVAAVLGIWLTWSGVLPALNLFDRFELWHYKGLVDGAETRVPVTLADLGLVLAVILVAAVAAKNLPALLEIVLLQISGVSPGGRYAIKTLTGYVIVVIAFLVVFSTLGLQWSQMQWLVAALGVGIGFGLQEIVANFISGIIILFERPVRVGDIVTIGDTSGVVTNIQIRATTIRNWDRQELLVPNKEFITGRLLNWTLTDQQTRISIPVGVEYGSDTRKALRILSEVAKDHPRTLDDPAPLITFEGFGDNALTLVLRCYMGTLEGRLDVTTELYQEVYDRFNASGIGIAFPQRDVHLSAREPIDVRLHASTVPEGLSDVRPQRESM